MKNGDNNVNSIKRCNDETIMFEGIADVRHTDLS